MDMFDTDSLTFHGREFWVTRYYDTDNSPPWENSDGHGSVRFISYRESLARGETVLCDTRDGRYVYDFGAAIVKAAREKWGLTPEDTAALAQRIGKKPTKAQIRAESVRQDMKFLRGWCADDWTYIGVCVQIIGPDGKAEGDEFDHALWGVESCGDYWKKVAEDLAGEILHDRGQAWRGALKEARARKYWASRDVVTVQGA